MSKPVEYAAPVYQSDVSARLLGSDDEDLVEFGQALIRLESAVFYQIARVKDCETDPNAVEYDARKLKVPASNDPRVAEFFQQLITSSIEADKVIRDRRFDQLLVLNGELSNALSWVERPDHFSSQIKQFVRKWRNR